MAMKLLPFPKAPRCLQCTRANKVRKPRAYAAVVCFLLISALLFLQQMDRLWETETNYREWQQRGLEYVLTSESERSLNKRQATRRKHVFETCQNTLNESFQPLDYDQTLRNMKPSQFRSLIFDDIYRTIYCEVPKVACSNWKRVLLLLTGKMNTTRAEDLASHDVHSRLEKTYLRRMDSLSLDEIELRLKTYYKFMFVREPFERLLSAYNNKFRTSYNELFKRVFGRKIIKRYRKNPTNESLEGGRDVTFKEFVAYLLDPKTTKLQPFNPHWRSYYDLCHPCLIQYDLIGKYETLAEDVALTLAQLGARGKAWFPVADPRRNRTSSLLAQKFANISTDDIHLLWNVYSKDFALFNYPYPNFSNSTITTL